MASFWGLLMTMSLSIIIIFIASPSLCVSSHQLKAETSITAAPALLPTNLVSPSTEVSPDIAPLLPSSGDAMPSTGSNSMPIIPSNPSQNPDEMAAFSPDYAPSPSGHSPDSSSVSLRSFNFAGFMVVVSCMSITVFAF